MKIEGLTMLETINVATEIYATLESLSILKVETTETAMQGLLLKLNLSPKQAFSFLREAISAQRVTPPLFQSLEILGKSEVMSRLGNAIHFLEIIE